MAIRYPFYLSQVDNLGTGIFFLVKDKCRQGVFFPCHYICHLDGKGGVVVGRELDKGRVEGLGIKCHHSLAYRGFLVERQQLHLVGAGGGFEQRALVGAPERADDGKRVDLLQFLGCRFGDIDLIGGGGIGPLRAAVVPCGELRRRDVELVAARHYGAVHLLRT